MAKVLLVEDDNNLREIYEARLTAEGYDIATAQDGEEALVSAKKEHPDLIISDVMMPRISGFEMLDILRNTDELKNTKIIMLTALGQAEDQARADNLGADKYLVKSQVTLEDIVNSAKELLGEPAPAQGSDAPYVGGDTPVTTPSPTPVAARTEAVLPAPIDAPAPIPASVPVAASAPIAAQPLPPIVPEQAPAAALATPPPSTIPPEPPIAPPVLPAGAPAQDTPVVPEPAVQPQTELSEQQPAPQVNPQESIAVAPPVAMPTTAAVVPAVAPLTPPVSAPPVLAEPELTPAEAAATPPSAPVAVEQTTVAEQSVASADPQSLAAEEAALQQQIDGFLNEPALSTLNDTPPQAAVASQPPLVSPPVKTPAAQPITTPQSSATDTFDSAIIADAVEKLGTVNSPDTVPAPLVITPQRTPEVAAPEVPVSPSAPPPTALGENVAIAHKKVLQPITTPSTKASLDELLAREEAAQGPPPATPMVNGQVATPPPEVEAPKPGQSFDPNSISL